MRKPNSSMTPTFPGKKKFLVTMPLRFCSTNHRNPIIIRIDVKFSKILKRRRQAKTYIKIFFHDRKPRPGGICRRYQDDNFPEDLMQIGFLEAEIGGKQSTAILNTRNWDPPQFNGVGRT